MNQQSQPSGESTPREKRIITLTLLILTSAFIFLIYRSYQLSFRSPIPVSMRTNEPSIRRGSILDSQNHELALSRDTISIGIRPKEVINPESTAKMLASTLSLPLDEVREKIYRNENFIWLVRKIPFEKIEPLSRAKIPGLTFEKERSRLYPNNRLASSVIGFTGIDNEGLAGIEYQFNNELTRSSNHEFTGHNIHLTINAFIQRLLEKALVEGMKKTNSKAAVGIITEVDTGRILAMASLPDFDPNEASGFPEQTHRNRAIAENIEPGSSFKIFSVAALLKEQMIEENQTYYCPGYFEYNGKKTNCNSTHGHLDMRGVIKKSCNSGIIQATWPLPIVRLHEHLKQFGFGTPTGIDLPGEQSGDLPHPSEWDIWLKMTIPIGQGVSVTPLQLVMAGNSIANGGKIMKPQIIDKITDTEGTILYRSKPEQKYIATTPEITNVILSYLQEVVRPGGTGHLASITDYDISAKTSTAQVWQNNRYEGFQASFLGFFPGSRPEISIYIWFDEPNGDRHQGGEIAAPVFKNVLLEIIPLVHKGNIKEIEVLDYKDRKEEYQDGVMPDLIGKSKKEAMFFLWTYFPGNHAIRGSGYVTRQFPAPGTPVTAPYSFNLEFNDNGKR